MTELPDFAGMTEFIKESRLPYKEAVVEYIAKQGESRNFTVRKYSSVVKHGVNLGKVDVAWLEPNTHFHCEFAKLEDALTGIVQSLEAGAEKIVLVLSSKGAVKPAHVKTLLEDSQILSSFKEKIVLLDVADGVT